MPEVAIATPFDADEIKTIACEEFRKRLDQLSPLSGLKEYAHFDIEFNVKVRLANAANMGHPKETLAWGSVEGGPSAADLDAVIEEEQIKASTFSSGDPNDERQARGMPLTVEVNDGKGGRKRQKVHVKG